MARSRRDGGRGSRVQTIYSGTTLATNPSGVTVDSTGINAAGTAISLTELGYIDNLAGYPLSYTSAAGYDTTAGMKTWAGSSIGIKPGFTTNMLATICAFVKNDAAVASPPIMIEQILTAGGLAVTVGLYTLNPSTATVRLYPSGGSIAWFAIGS
jgi:hypothetical protein